MTGLAAHGIIELIENCFPNSKLGFVATCIVVLTNINGIVTDTFSYDTYGKLLSHIGASDVIFGYNGRDGVVTDANGLICMRARYYSPEMRRFVNADIVPGQISNAVTLNRFSYANGNPVSWIDPLGLCADKEHSPKELETSMLNVMSSVKSQQDLHSFQVAVFEVLNNIPVEAFSIDKEFKFEYSIDDSTKVYLKMVFNVGDGENNLNYDQIKAQLESESVLAFLDASGVLSKDYTLFDGELNLTDSTVLSVSSSAEVDIVEHTLTWKAQSSVLHTMQSGGAFSLTVGLSKEIEADPPESLGRQPKSQLIFNLDYAYIRDQELSWDRPLIPIRTPYNHNDYYRDTSKGLLIASALVLSAGLVVAVAETIVTAGAGFWNDLILAPMAFGAWKQVFS